MSNSHVYKNTIYLYIRMFVMMIISLFTSRIILQTLGASDFGLFNVVGGFIAFFFFISNSLSLATQRFMAYAMGQNDILKRKQVFTISLLLYSVLSLLILILGLLIGIPFIKYQLNIPLGRENVAIIVYVWSLLAAICTFIRIPYTAAIISHEKMSFYSWISIIESILKLVSLYLLYLIDYDKLVVYAILQMIASLIITIWHVVYCKRFDDYTKNDIYNLSIIKQMSSYIGWNVFGGFADLMIIQGLNVILNLFFGTLINAAQAIAVQIKSQIASLVNNLNIASGPAITKYYASNNFKQCEQLMFTISKLDYLLLYIVSLPIMMVLPSLLNIWLGKGEYPELTINITNLILINTLIDTLPGAIQSVVFASGKIKKYTIIISTIKLLSITFVYISLYIVDSPIIPYLILILFAFPRIIYQIYYCTTLLNFKIIIYIKDVIVPGLLVTVYSLIISLLFYYVGHIYLSNEMIKFFFVGSLSFLITIIFSYFVGLNQFEKIRVKAILKNKFSLIR